MDVPLEHMKQTLQDSLDQFCSPKSNSTTRKNALRAIEKCLASAVISRAVGGVSAELDLFNTLQCTFECNVPSRLLGWVATSTAKLDFITNKGSMDDEREAEALGLASQLTAALLLIQGVSLNHVATKAWLGRKYPLEILLDLLLASRHLSSIAMPNPALSLDLNGNPIEPVVPLSSVVLDTLLCILVDLPEALRAFEGVHGVQAVVRILKRAATPREVRMKCLEFLYFYLLDEKISPETVSPSKPAHIGLTPPTPSPPAPPALPLPQNQPSKKPYLNGFTPNLPSSRQLSSSSSVTHPSSSSASSSGSSDVSVPTTNLSSRSTSASSAHSFTSNSSHGSSSTAASSVIPMSRNPSHEKNARPPLQSSQSTLAPPPSRLTPLPSPASRPRPAIFVQPRLDLQMLNKDIDYTPLSPIKAPVSASRMRSESSTGSMASITSVLGTPATPVGARTTTPTLDSNQVKARNGNLTRTTSKFIAKSKPASSEAEDVCRDLGPALTPRQSQRKEPSLQASQSRTGRRRSALMDREKNSPSPSLQHQHQYELGRKNGHQRGKSNVSSASSAMSSSTSTSTLSVASSTPSSVMGDTIIAELTAHGNGKKKTRDVRKTTEQKKELLGTMLGNVDALVDGVRGAGVWGLA